MERIYTEEKVTSPGGSDILQEATLYGKRGSQAGSTSDPKTTNVPAQALVGTHVGVQRCAPKKTGTAPDGDNENYTQERTKQSKEYESVLKTKLLQAQNTKKPGLITAMSNLKNLIKMQNKIMGTLLESTDHLNLVKEKSKSPQLRDAIDAVVEAVEALSQNRNTLHGGFYEAEKAAVRANSEQEATAPLHDQNEASLVKQDAILKFCEELKASVAKQQVGINQLMASSVQSKEVHNQVPSLTESAIMGNQETILDLCREIRKGTSETIPPEIITRLDSQDAKLAFIMDRMETITNRSVDERTADKTSQRAPELSRTTKPEHNRGKPKADTDTQDSGARTQEEGFTLVKNRKKKQTRSAEHTDVTDRRQRTWPYEGSEPTKGKLKELRLRLPLPDSIAVKPTPGESFADILRSVRDNVNMQEIGANVTSIKKSRNGDILFRLPKVESRIKELEEALSATLGNRAKVRVLAKHEEVEILDLDAVTTEAEILESLQNALRLPDSDKSIKIRSLRPAHGGTLRASVTMKETNAYKIAKMGKIKIGWILVRVRIKKQAIKCYKCLRYGHTRFTCNGPDRAEWCSLCQSLDHRGPSCTNSPKCVACSDINAPTDHYPGSKRCAAYQKALVGKAGMHVHHRVDSVTEESELATQGEPKATTSHD